MGFTKSQLASECRQSGPQLRVPSGVNGPQLLWAISGNESSFGAHCTPRHDPAFDVGGRYGDGPIMKPLLAKYGKAAACSYGPWQIMFCNAPEGFTPASFDDLHQCTVATVARLNAFLRKWQPQTIAGIGECWNAGHPLVSPSPGVTAYVQELEQNYAVQLPD